MNLDRAEAVPIQVGADETEVDAFAALADWGIGIPVGDGPRETAARYALGHTGEVRTCSTRWRREFLAGPREAGTLTDILWRHEWACCSPSASSR